MMDRLGGWWTVIAIALLGGVAVLGHWTSVRDGACGASGEACRARALRGDPSLARLEDRPRLVVFSSASCPACARMKPVVAEVERDCGAAKDVAHVDVDDDTGESFAAAYGVTLLPTFLSVDARGREVARLTGVQPAATLERALEEVRGAKCSSSDERPKAM